MIWLFYKRILFPFYVLCSKAHIFSFLHISYYVYILPLSTFNIWADIYTVGDYSRVHWLFRVKGQWIKPSYLEAGKALGHIETVSLSYQS